MSSPYDFISHTRNIVDIDCQFCTLVLQPACNISPPHLRIPNPMHPSTILQFRFLTSVSYLYHPIWLSSHNNFDRHYIFHLKQIGLQIFQIISQNINGTFDQHSQLIILMAFVELTTLLLEIQYSKVTDALLCLILRWLAQFHGLKRQQRFLTR